MERSTARAIGIAVASLVVFAVAVTLRVPSCYESFWIDELHTSWVVWDSLSDVSPRANLGHQSPFYFAGLWFWKQLVGESEVALRLSSVLALSLSCAILTVGVARWSGSLLAGIVAGMLVATETNSLFFGTELRPYATVVLFASVAFVLFLDLAISRSRHEHRWNWLGMNAAILLAILCQPTAVGLLLLPATLLIGWLIRDPSKVLRFNLSDAFIVLGGSAVGFALWNVTLNQTWTQRDAWKSFAAATHWQQMWQIWDWSSLWVLPLVVTATAIATAVWSRRLPEVRRPSTLAIWMACIAFVMTATYWWVSWMNWVPVWHRRYFIAVVPAFACLSGLSVAALQAGLGSHRQRQLLSIVTAGILMVLVPYQQGTIQQLPNYPVALAKRGEDWRGALQWVRSNARSNDLIYLDAGLIENRTWLNRTLPVSSVVNLDQAHLDYLTFAGRGPYSLDRNAIPIDAGGSLLFLTGNPSRRVFVILRRPASQIAKSIPFRSNLYRFGHVTVIVQASTTDQMML
jgi:mannosyltransferase